MAPSSLSSTFRYRPNLLSPQNLSTSDKIDDAIYELEQSITHDNFAKVVERIIEFEDKGVLLLVLACLSSETPLALWMSQTFSSKSADYESSITARVLSELSKIGDFEGLSASTDRRRLIETVSDALKAIKQMKFNDKPQTEMALRHIKRSRMGGPSQRELKNARKNTFSIDIKPLVELGLSAPKNAFDAEAMTFELLSMLQDHFTFYMNKLRTPEIAGRIKSGFIAAEEYEVSPKPLEGEGEAKLTDDEASIVQIATAFPHIQPMKVAFNFDNVEGLGDWQVAFSSDLITTLRKKDIPTFRIVVKKVLELSNGYFSDDNHKRLKGMKVGIEVYEAKLSRDLRLIYQIDCVPYDDEREWQAIKILDLCSHAQMDDRMWNRLCHPLQRRSKEYQNRCSAREPAGLPGEKVYTPKFFPPFPEVFEPAVDVPELPVDSDPQDQNRHNILIQKFVVFSEPVLKSLMAKVKLTFPHLVSREEQGIIEHPNSCYVLGRSGTGKTTTMLFKMLLVERSYQMLGDGSKPRQVFITQSPVLARNVKEYFDTLMASFSVIGLPEEEMLKKAKMLPLSLSHGTLIKEDHRVDLNINLPCRFSELEDSHFPVITTVNRLWTMIEADFGCPHFQDTDHSIKELLSTESSLKRLDYFTFQREYWPHFSQDLTKRLEPSLAYTEILGIIMGSEKTLVSNLNALDRKTYTSEDVSFRKHATFADRRDLIYSLYELYQKKKAERQEYDAAERTHCIIRLLRDKGVLGKVDRIYVDEVQDNLLIDTYVMRALCRDRDGLFFAGDTAQQISVGSSFSFNELKAFQYRLEKGDKIKGTSNHTPEPKTFQLVINYRSHNGIVKCAHSVIQLISHFWPSSIDRLNPEMGMADGHEPLFFSSNKEESQQLVEFLFGDDGHPVEFGAQQCIIVRNDMARDELRQQIGDAGLIYTIYESKGLEFNDVLLYNFFRDSTASEADWRVVLNALHHNDSEKTAAPAFDEIRHASVCVELKFLYVAITRARENLWIADFSPKGSSMKKYWTSKRSIQNVTGHSVPRLGRVSSPEEWDSKGEELFGQDRFEHAKLCFSRAQQPGKEAQANAYWLMQKANGILEAQRSERCIAFLEAADAFSASITQFGADKLVYSRLAADCFHEAGDRLRAATFYEQGEDWSRAAVLFRSMKSYDEAVRLAKMQSLLPGLSEQIIREARLYYFTHQRLSDGISLYDSTEEAIDYLEERGLDVARADVLQMAGRYCEAGELHFAEGNPVKAVTLFLSQKDDSYSMQRALECIVGSLWSKLPIGVTPEDVPSEVDQLLAFIPRLDPQFLEKHDGWYELLTFQAVLKCDRTTLFVLSQKNHKAGRLAAALLALDHYFLSMLYEQMPVTELLNDLRAFHVYSEEMAKIISHSHPSKDGEIMKLCGVLINPNIENEFHLAPNSILWRYLPQAVGSEHEDISLSSAEIRFAVHGSMSSRLQEAIVEQDEIVRRASCLSPCLAYTISGRCRRQDCPEQHSVSSSIAACYNARIHVHLCQIMILQVLHSACAGCDQDLRVKHRRWWVERLYEAMYPPHHMFGDRASLNLLFGPQATKAIRVVKDWIRSLVHNLSFHARHFLSDLSRSAILGLFFDSMDAGDYLFRGTRYMNARLAPPYYFLYPGGEYIIPYQLVAIQGYTVWSLSAGILSVKHIIENRLQINASLLCDLLEYLCANLILSSKMGRVGNLHNSTLPKSWIIRHLRHNEEAVRHRDCHIFHLLIDPMTILLDQLYSGTDYLLYGGRTLDSFSRAAIRNVFLNRVCIILGLLGYNFTGDIYRDRILRAFQSLNKDNRSFAKPCDRFVFSNTWADVSKAIRRALLPEFNNRGNTDEMIQLVHKSRESEFRNRPPIFGVRRLTYDSIEELLVTLGKSDDGSKIHSLAPDTTLLDILPEEEEADIIEIQEKVSEAVIESSEIPQLEAVQYSEEVFAAAVVFQRQWRFRQSRRQPFSRDNQSDTLLSFFQSCSAKVNNITRDKLYSKYFLGSLPHILLCLSMVSKRVHTLKKQGRKQRFQEDQDLSALDAELTKNTKKLKDVINITKQLGPDSPIHAQGDFQKLRQLIQVAKELIEDEQGDDVLQHLDLGAKSILTPSRPQSPIVKSLEDTYLGALQYIRCHHSSGTEGYMYQVPLAKWVCGTIHSIGKGLRAENRADTLYAILDQLRNINFDTGTEGGVHLDDLVHTLADNLELAIRPAETQSTQVGRLKPMLNVSDIY